MCCRSEKGEEENRALTNGSTATSNGSTSTLDQECNGAGDEDRAHKVNGNGGVKGGKALVEDGSNNNEPDPLTCVI